MENKKWCAWRCGKFGFRAVWLELGEYGSTNVNILSDDKSDWPMRCSDVEYHYFPQKMFTNEIEALQDAVRLNLEEVEKLKRELKPNIANLKKGIKFLKGQIKSKGKGVCSA